MTDESVSALVKRLRKRLGLTQEQLAQRVGVTYSTINHWENGKRLPQPFLARRLRQLESELDAGSARVLVPAAGSHPRSRPRGGKRSGGAEPGARGLPTEVGEMIGRIVERFSPERVILFGSHARGDAGPESDVDLLVVMPVRGSKREVQLNLRKALRDIPVPKDVIVTTPEDFAWRKHVAGTIEWPAAREGRVMHVKE